MRKIPFSLFLFLLLFSSSAAAFEDTTEAYQTDWTEKYYIAVWAEIIGNPSSHTGGEGSASIVPDPRCLKSNTVISLNAYPTYGVYYPAYLYAYLVPYEPTYSPYFSYISPGYSVKIPPRYSSSYAEPWVTCKVVRGDNDQIVIAQFEKFNRTGLTDLKFEIIKSGSYYDLYVNGVLTQSVLNEQPHYYGAVKYCPGSVAYKRVSNPEPPTVSTYLDDLTDSSIIGTNQLYTEADENITFTWSTQLMREYSDQHRITLYSLTNPNNAGKIKTWNIPQDDDSDMHEHGYANFSRNDVLGLNYGLYLFEMTRGDEILTNQYFYYDQLSVPNGFPEILFLGESSVKTEIRDDNYNGGEIAGGGSVYLYPTIKENGTYNFSYNILEAPYKIRTELTTVYNNTPINSTTINFSGLSNQNYKISVDGADTGSTNGADTFSHTFTDWGTEKNHIISFAPDYTLAGVWGEVKNPETQQGIKSATVSISGANFSKTLYTDDNGLYYLTKGMEPGKTYTITVSKTGYTTPPSQTAITVDGSTTRQDFYMDKIPGVDGEGLYYSPHNVRFVVTDRYLFERYDANVTISGENVTTETQRTGTDGVCVFKMTENTRYEIVTEYNGMKQTDYISPIEYSYYIILDATKTSLLPTSQFYEMCNITITKNELNSSHAEITASYSDTGSDTQSVYFTLGKTDGNNTMNALETSPTGNGNMTYTFVVQDYIGEDYVVKVNVDHNKFGNVEKQYGVNFPGSKLPFTGNAIIALCVLIFFVVAMQWGKADAHMGAVLICGLGWWFYYLDIFRKLGDGTNAVIGTGLGLATVYAILSMINRKRDEGGI